MVTPLALSLWPAPNAATEGRVRPRWFDGLAAALGLIVVALFMAADKGIFHGVQIRPIVLFPFVVYTAARSTPRVTTLVIVAFA
jgi:hypothetical protein